MKRILFYIAAAAIGAMLAVSCTPKEENFDETLLHSGSGSWDYTHDYGSGPENITLKFYSNHTGYQITDTQPEPQNFDWELVGSRLTFIHHMGGVDGDVPEDCTVSTLTETSLIYTDERGRKISCTKQ